MTARLHKVQEKQHLSLHSESLNLKFNPVKAFSQEDLLCNNCYLYCCAREDLEK